MRESPTKLRCAILEEAMTTVDFSSQAGPMVTPRSSSTPPRRYAVEAMKHAAEITAGGLIIALRSIVASLWTRIPAAFSKPDGSNEAAYRSTKGERSVVSFHGSIGGSRNGNLSGNDAM